MLMGEKSCKQSGTLSVCLIVKNEAANLERCLTSIEQVSDETVVVDTGSTDETVKIAQSCGASVIETTWRDDFADARNLSIRNAHGKWILWLDADDVVPEVSIKELIALKHENTNTVFGFIVRNQKPGDTGTEFIQARMFPNRPDIYFERRIHEQMMPSALRAGLEMERRDIVIEHHGYGDPTTVKQKALRNIGLLLKEFDPRFPDSVLSVEIADSYMLAGNHAEAGMWYEKTLAIPQCEKTTPVIAGHAHYGLANLYNEQKMYNDAIIHCNQALHLSPWRPDILYSMAVALELNGDTARATECLKKIRTISETPGQVGVDFRACRIKARLRLIRIFAEMNMLNDGMEIVSESLEQFPNRPEILNAAGRFSVKAGKIIDALHLFEKSIMLTGVANLDAYIGLCVIYRMAGRQNVAHKTLQSIQEVFTKSLRYWALYTLFFENVEIPNDVSHESIENARKDLSREFFGLI